MLVILTLDYRSFTVQSLIKLIHDNANLNTKRMSIKQTF